MRAAAIPVVAVAALAASGTSRADIIQWHIVEGFAGSTKFDGCLRTDVQILLSDSQYRTPSDGGAAFPDLEFQMIRRDFCTFHVLSHVEGVTSTFTNEDGRVTATIDAYDIVADAPVVAEVDVTFVPDETSCETLMQVYRFPTGGFRMLRTTCAATLTGDVTLDGEALSLDGATGQVAEDRGQNHTH